MKYLKIIASFVCLLSLASCEKTEEVNNTDDRIGHSRVIFFPTISIVGESVILVPLGQTFTDPGALAQVAGADVTYSTTGTVNTNAAGVYQLIYTAVNSEGFSKSASRIVVVYSTDPSAAANDLSGNYARTSNGSIARWTKIAPGVYSVFNPGGAPGTNLTVIVFNQTGFNIKIPVQPASDGSPITSDAEVYNNTTPASYTWRIVNQGYGTALRTFVKQ